MKSKEPPFFWISGAADAKRQIASVGDLIAISKPTVAENFFSLKKPLLVHCHGLRRMGQPQGRKSKKHTNGNHPLHRTRNYGRDVDQIHGDISEKQKTILKNTVVDEDKPGLGVWYCLECARWFIDETTLTKHKSTKIHKRRYPLPLVPTNE